MSGDRVAPRHLNDYLLAHGRPVVDLSEVSALTRLAPKAAAAALVRLRQSGQMFSPYKGLYVAVPPQYRSWGTVPASDFIDPMMTAMGRNYYVAMLSAAELYGIAHQRPQVFQVMVNKTTRNRDFGRVRLRFYANNRLHMIPTQVRNTATGQMRIATPEATSLDLVSRPNEAGGLDNVATVVAEFADEGALDVGELLRVSESYPVSSLRRLGWLLERFQSHVDTKPIQSYLENAPRQGRAETLLDQGGPRRGPASSRWKVVENAVVEPDL